MRNPDVKVEDGVRTDIDWLSSGLHVHTQVCAHIQTEEVGKMEKRKGKMGILYLGSRGALGRRKG